MNFKELQRFFSGGSTEAEKMYLLSLFHSTKGRKVLDSAFEEGWSTTAHQKINIWNPDFCFLKILEKIISDHNTINNNTN